MLQLIHIIADKIENPVRRKRKNPSPPLMNRNNTTKRKDAFGCRKPRSAKGKNDSPCAQPLHACIDSSVMLLLRCRKILSRNHRIVIERGRLCGMAYEPPRRQAYRQRLSCARKRCLRGIDMTDFENDGYILRTEGGSVTVAGKTETGLDLAVRRYANAGRGGHRV